MWAFQKRPIHCSRQYRQCGLYQQQLLNDAKRRVFWFTLTNFRQENELPAMLDSTVVNTKSQNPVAVANCNADIFLSYAWRPQWLARRSKWYSKLPDKLLVRQSLLYTPVSGAAAGVPKAVHYTEFDTIVEILPTLIVPVVVLHLSKMKPTMVCSCMNRNVLFASLRGKIFKFPSCST